MYMSKATLDTRKLALSGGPIPGNVYDAHKALWMLFGDHPDRRRDFVYRETDPGRFLVVSAREPVDPGGFWTLETKPYAPVIEPGERLYFSLRANAVRKSRDGKGRQVRHDAVQDARKRLQAEGVAEEDMPPRPVLAQEAGQQWLLGRQEALGLAIKPEGLLVGGYAVHEFRRKGGVVRFSTLDFRGFAEVADPEGLVGAMYAGVGPSKGFGCGLLTVMRR